MKNIAKYNKTMKTAKAIYVVSGLRDTIIYLDAKQEIGDITAEDNYEIFDLVRAAYVNVTVDELNKIRNMF